MRFSKSSFIIVVISSLSSSLLDVVSSFSIQSKIASSTTTTTKATTSLFLSAKSSSEKQQQVDDTTTNPEIITSNKEAPCYDSNCLLEINDDDDESNEDNIATTGAKETSNDQQQKQQQSQKQSQNLSNFQGQATQRLSHTTGPTVWSEFGRIASLHPSIANLGQGFPDWLPPQFAIDALVDGVQDTAINSPHQYTRPAGHPKLVKELAGRYSKHLGRGVDAMEEVAVTVGASQALYLALQTLIKPGKVLCCCCEC